MNNDDGYNNGFNELQTNEVLPDLENNYYNKITFLKTPYKRSIVQYDEINPINSVLEPTYNYTPYDLFCLRTKFQPYAKELLKLDVGLQFKSIEAPSQMDLIIMLTINNNFLFLNDNLKTKLEHKISQLTNNKENYALLFNFDTQLLSYNGEIIPKSWIVSMVPYVNIDLLTIYDIYMGEYGLYAYLGKENDYINFYQKLTILIHKQLKRMYQIGYITNVGNIADSWSLQSLDIDKNLYIPTWSNSDFASNMVNFLTLKSNGNKFICLNYNKKFKLDKKFYHQGNKIYIEVDNLDQALKLLKL